MKPPRIELICVGSELLMGKVNTHGAYVSRKLEENGFALACETTVSDDPDEMRRVFEDVWERADVVICTGGLGPTFDDITREAWSKVLRRPLRFRADLLAGIRDKFRGRKIRMPAENRRQAFVLSGAEVMRNDFGTAPGQSFVAGGKALGIFPGPPKELHPMFENAFLPRLRPLFNPPARRTLVFRFFGEAESVIDARLDAVRRVVRPDTRAGVTWGILAHFYMIDVKATVSGPREEDVERRAAEVRRLMRRRFGDAIFGEGEQTLEEIVGDLLRRRRETLSVAESCTGGLLGARITRVPGSSDYFVEGRVVYSYAAKTRLLGVKPRTLKKHGAVSRACALEMAAGCRKRAATTWALSVTGIAGPAAERGGKPVGLVHIALAGPRGAASRENRFWGSRDDVRERSAMTALDWLRRELLKGAPARRAAQDPHHVEAAEL